MLDRSAASAIASTEINKHFHSPGDELVVLDEFTIEKPYGWIFFTTSRLFRETKDPAHMVGGNSPIVVLFDGTHHYLGTHKPVDSLIQDFEKRTGLAGARPQP